MCHYPSFLAENINNVYSRPTWKCHEITFYQDVNVIQYVDTVETFSTNNFNDIRRFCQTQTRKDLQIILNQCHRLCCQLIGLMDVVHVIDINLPDTGVISYLVLP